MAKKKGRTEDLIRSFSRLNALIIGGRHVDSYLWGQVSR
jgi:hypothetical protein